MLRRVICSVTVICRVSSEHLIYKLQSCCCQDTTVIYSVQSLRPADSSWHRLDLIDLYVRCYLIFLCFTVFNSSMHGIFVINGIKYYWEKQVFSSLSDTRTFNGPVYGTTLVSWYQTGKTNLDFTESRDSKCQWHQLGHMQVCTSLQTDNHASTAPLSFFCECPSCCPTNSVIALKALVISSKAYGLKNADLSKSWRCSWKQVYLAVEQFLLCYWICSGQWFCVFVSLQFCGTHTVTVITLQLWKVTRELLWTCISALMAGLSVEYLVKFIWWSYQHGRKPY